ncbi:ATP-binding protein [Streptomyces sp. NPDC048057]|uniref:ATP-binding protein n=1 Tax=Streptomyces sp. NPDC048057 TaxID=3155628 RepID=UPI0033D21F9C
MAELPTATPLSPPSVRARTSTASGSLSIDLALTPSALGVVRSIVAAHLELWGTAHLGDLPDRVVLVVTELLANVLDHAVDPRDATAKNATLLIVRIPEALVTVVTDADTTPPTEPHELDDASEDGRGLLLVQSVADGFGVSVKKDGKDVWARFHCPDPETEAPPLGKERC